MPVNRLKINELGHVHDQYQFISKVAGLVVASNNIKAVVIIAKKWSLINNCTDISQCSVLDFMTNAYILVPYNSLCN